MRRVLFVVSVLSGVDVLALEEETASSVSPRSMRRAGEQLAPSPPPSPSPNRPPYPPGAAPSPSPPASPPDFSEEIGQTLGLTITILILGLLLCCVLFCCCTRASNDGTGRCCGLCGSGPFRNWLTPAGEKQATPKVVPVGKAAEQGLVWFPLLKIGHEEIGLENGVRV